MLDKTWISALVFFNPGGLFLWGDHLFLNYIFFFWQLLLINRGALLILTWQYTQMVSALGFTVFTVS